MLYEVDFLPVGEGESSGDSICLRYSSDNGESWIVGVIDGGTKVTGEKVCSHVYMKLPFSRSLVCEKNKFVIASLIITFTIK